VLIGGADPVRFTDGTAQFIDANVGNGASFFLSNLYDISGQFYTRLHHEQSPDTGSKSRLTFHCEHLHPRATFWTLASGTRVISTIGHLLEAWASC
jgi:hypothetical protein